MSEQLRNKCKSLRLAYIAEIYERIPFDTKEQFLSDLLDEELHLREIAKAHRLIKKARFLDKKSLEEYEWTEQVHMPSHLDKEELLGWIL